MDIIGIIGIIGIAPTVLYILSPFETIEIIEITSLALIVFSILYPPYFNKRARRKNLFKSLYDEIKLNQEIVKNMKNNRKNFKIVSMAEPLYTFSYENIRKSDELTILSKKLRKDLDKVYLLIYIHNHSYYGLRGLFEDIFKKFEPLKLFNIIYEILDRIVFLLLYKDLEKIVNESFYDRLNDIAKRKKIEIFE